MVYMHFPQSLTEEEEMLQKKYAKLRKKKKALAALRAPKTETPQPDPEKNKKRTAEAAADATQQAKKLLKLGAIKVESDKKDLQSFKRTKRQKEQERPSVGFTPFSPTHCSAVEHEEDRPEISRPRLKGLRDSFVPSREARFEGEQHDREERRPREPPKRGHTIYVHGHGITEDMIRKTFAPFGNINHVTLEKDKNCSFVTFEKMESSDQAITEMSGTMVGETQLRVSMARRQPNFESSTDPSSTSWSSIAANQSQKSAYKDKRDLVTYAEEDLF